MRRRLVFVILVALVLFGVLLLRRSPQPPSPAAGILRERPRGASLRAFDQRPAVTLLPPSGKPAQIAAPSGAFEGRVVSAITGRGLPGAQLTFSRTEETSSVIAGPDGAFRFDARVPGRWFLAAATAQGHQP